MDVGFFSLPASAGPRDRLIGQDDAGNPAYETATGEIYVVRPEAQRQGGNALAGFFNAGRNPNVRLRDMAGGVVNALAQGAMQGMTAPGRAARGEPVTYGDAWATALDWGIMSPLGRAPQGALRSGASRSDDGIRAYHGSPHDFDEFRMDKIGTGEGAQAYGHGLYFAESEDVARSYRDTLAGKANADPFRVTARTILAKYNGDQQAALEHLRRSAEAFGDTPRGNSFKYAAEALESGADLSDAGRMYEVRLKANPDDFLDWDAPLSQQPRVAEALGRSTRPEQDIHDEALRLMEEGNAKAGRNGGWMDDTAIRSRIDELQDELDRVAPNLTGQEYYRGGAEGDVSNLLSQMGYGNPIEQSRGLREAGIPGIKYLDQGSRGQGQGTRNYVVFDESIIEIVRKYGIAGAAIMLGMSEAEVREAVGES